MNDRSRSAAILRNTLIVVLFGAMGLSAYIWQSNREPAIIELEQAYLTAPPRPIVWNELIDQDGDAFIPKHLRRKWTYLYMGYRSCPDACPVALAILSRVSRQLSALDLPEDQQPQFIFLSVDPQRDTPELLKGYVAFFGTDFIGITGDDVELKAVAAQLGGIFFVPEDPKPENYEVGHSNSVYLMNPQGQLRAILRPPHDPDMIVRNHLKLID